MVVYLLLEKESADYFVVGVFVVAPAAEITIFRRSSEHPISSLFSMISLH